MFSPDGPDPGSLRLAAAFEGRLKGRVADLGAGWGWLAHAALARCPAITAIDLYEADANALDAARAERRRSARRLPLGRRPHARPRRPAARRGHREPAVPPRPRRRPGPRRRLHRRRRAAAEAGRPAADGREPPAALRSGARRRLRALGEAVRGRRLQGPRRRAPAAALKPRRRPRYPCAVARAHAILASG